MVSPPEGTFRPPCTAVTVALPRGSVAAHVQAAVPHSHVVAAVEELEDLRYEHFTLEGYDPHPHIPAPISV